MSDQEAVFVSQLDDFSRPEKVDITKYCFKVICKEPGCFKVRYVLPQDKTKVQFCKPHARAKRLANRAERARGYRLRDKLKTGV